MAITIKHLTNSGKGEVKAIQDYLETADSAADYYSASAGKAIRFLGRGAQAHRLSDYDPRRMTRMLAGRTPDGSANLATRKGGAKGTRRAATDVTLSAPKSVSAIALTTDPRLIAAHDAAVAAAIAEIERRIAGYRLGKGGRGGRVEGADLIVAAYRHEDARPVGGLVSPQLHTHCAILNMLKKESGDWASIDLAWGQGGEGLRLIDYVYQSELARRCRDLGYEVRATEEAFEIQGINDEQIDSLSLRSAQIRKELAARGIGPDAPTAVKKIATVATRERKGDQTHGEMRQGFVAMVEAAGIDAYAISGQALVPRPGDAGAAARSVSDTVASLSEQSVVIARADILREALRLGIADGVTIDEIESAIDSNPDLIRSGDSDRYTTKAAVQIEVETLAMAESGRGAVDALYTDVQVAMRLQARDAESEYKLTQGQRESVMLALTTQDRVVAIRGAAGAGKTTGAIDLIAQATKEQGLEVVGLAPTHQAKSGLADAGLDSAGTLAAFLASESPSDGRPRVYILDEAGMVGAADMRALLARIDAEGARLVLVGDHRQLEAVAAGNPFQRLIETRSVEMADMPEILRQKDADQLEIANLFAAGKAEEAVGRLDRYVTEVKSDKPNATKEDHKAAAIAETARRFTSLSADERKSALLLAGTNKSRQTLNAEIRSALKASGDVGLAEIKITALDRVNITQPLRQRASRYPRGTRLVVPGKGGDRAYKVLGAMDKHRIEVAEIGKAEKTIIDLRKVDDLTRLRIYRERDMHLAVGDRVTWRGTEGKKADKVINGAMGTVVNVEGGKATVVLDDGRMVKISGGEAKEIDHGWAVTTHKSQGATVDRVIVFAENTVGAVANLAYVALTRQRKDLDIITADFKSVAARWMRFSSAESAVIESGSDVDALVAKAKADIERERVEREATAKANAEATVKPTAKAKPKAKTFGGNPFTSPNTSPKPGAGAGAGAEVDQPKPAPGKIRDRGYDLEM